MILEEVLFSAGSAAVYSMVFYVKKRASKGEVKFNPFKLAATVGVGAVIGGIYAVSGMEFTRGEIATQLTTYAGTVALVETMIKAAWRGYKQRTSGTSAS